MPERWSVYLAGPRADKIELTHLHAALTHWFDHRPPTEDDSRAPCLDSHNEKTKDYSLSAPALTDDGIEVEIGTLTDTAAGSLAHHAVPGSRLRLGRAVFVVQAPPSLAASATWDQLADATGSRAWQVRFDSPASFMRGQHSSPLPTPEAVLAGLATRWRRWAPPTNFTPDDAAARRVRVTDLSGGSTVVTVGHRHFGGFVGTVRYETDIDAAAAVGPLFALAPYSGVGAGTTKGLGVTRIEQAWPVASASLHRASEARQS